MRIASIARLLKWEECMITETMCGKMESLSIQGASWALGYPRGPCDVKKVCFSVNSSAAKHAMPTKIRKDGQVPRGHLVIRPWCWPLRREGNIFFANTLKWEWVLRHICWRSFTWNFCLLKLDLRGMKGNLPPVIPEDGYWGLFHPITQITLAVRLFPFLIVWPACYKWLKEVQKAGPRGAEVTLNGEDSPKRSQRWT